MNHALKTIFIFTNDNVYIIFGITTEYHYISNSIIWNYMEYSTVSFENTPFLNIVSQRVFLIIPIKFITNYLSTCKISFHQEIFFSFNSLDNAQILRRCNIKITNTVQRATQKWIILKSNKVM